MVAQLEFAVGKTLPVDIRCVREQVAEVLILATCAPEFAIEATIHKFSDGTPLNEKPSIIVLRTLDKPEREAWILRKSLRMSSRAWIYRPPEILIWM